MSLPVILRPEAEADILSAHAELEAVRIGLGRQFASRVREVFERVELMPELYAEVWHDVRAARVRRFRYVVYYLVFADRIEVIAVMHGSRDSSAWRSRS